MRGKKKFPISCLDGVKSLALVWYWGFGFFQCWINRGRKLTLQTSKSCSIEVKFLIFQLDFTVLTLTQVKLCVLSGDLSICIGSSISSRSKCIHWAQN